MGKTAIIYWSGTGNTEEMAKAIQAGTRQAGAEAQLFEVEQFSPEEMGSYDGFFFGCPAMGDEVLEESVFEPFFAAAEQKLAGVPVALFGSYGWGGGAWMESWAERREAGRDFSLASATSARTPIFAISSTSSGLAVARWRLIRRMSGRPRKPSALRHASRRTSRKGLG